MNGNKTTAGSVVDKEETMAQLNELLNSLRDLKKTLGTNTKEGDEEWKKISITFDSLIEENVMSASKKEKVGEPSANLKPTGYRNSFSTLGRRRLLKNLLEQRERLHAKERTSDREVISYLINGKILLAESFKTVINAICVERDHKVAELETRYQELYDDYEELACNPSRQPSRLRVMMAGFEKNGWSGTFEAGSLREALDKALAKGRALQPYKVDGISDDDFTSDDDDEEELCGDLEELTVDRRSASVDRQGAEKWGDGLDEKFKGLWAWKPQQQPPEPVTAHANRAPRDEDGRPRHERFLGKDGREEEIYLGCMVTNCTEGKPVKPLMCLIDTGASTNITSWREIIRLGLKYDIEDVGHVKLAGGATVAVNAVARNVHLRIGDSTIEVDLNIMPMIDNSDRLGETILGTGFLRSVGAVIDFDVGRMSFNKIDPDEFYYWRRTPRQRGC